jgi:hypothetical protein
MKCSCGGQYTFRGGGTSYFAHCAACGSLVPMEGMPGSLAFTGSYMKLAYAEVVRGAWESKESEVAR